MRKFMGRSLAVVTLAAAAVIPLSGMAQAAPHTPAVASLGYHDGYGQDRCDRGRGDDESRDGGGRRCCDRDDYRHQYGYRGGLLGGLLGIL